MIVLSSNVVLLRDLPVDSTPPRSFSPRRTLLRAIRSAFEDEGVRAVESMRLWSYIYVRLSSFGFALRSARASVAAIAGTERVPAPRRARHLWTPSTETGAAALQMNRAGWFSPSRREPIVCYSFIVVAAQGQPRPVPGPSPAEPGQPEPRLGLSRALVCPDRVSSGRYSLPHDFAL